MRMGWVTLLCAATVLSGCMRAIDGKAELKSLERGPVVEGSLESLFGITRSQPGFFGYFGDGQYTKGEGASVVFDGSYAVATFELPPEFAGVMPAVEDAWIAARSCEFVPKRLLVGLYPVIREPLTIEVKIALAYSVPEEGIDIDLLKAPVDVCLLGIGGSLRVVSWSGRIGKESFLALR